MELHLPQKFPMLLGRNLGSGRMIVTESSWGSKTRRSFGCMARGGHLFRPDSLAVGAQMRHSGCCIRSGNLGDFNVFDAIPVSPADSKDALAVGPMLTAHIATKTSIGCDRRFKTFKMVLIYPESELKQVVGGTVISRPVQSLTRGGL
jgi:hypothetical protein